MTNNIDHNDAVTLCLGFPVPAVSWYQGTMKLVPSNNILLSSTGGRHQLSIVRLVATTTLELPTVNFAKA